VGAKSNCVKKSVWESRNREETDPQGNGLKMGVGSLYSLKKAKSTEKATLSLT